MDKAEIVKEFLATHPGLFYCNRCLGEEAGVTNTAQVNQLTRPLKGIKPYRVGSMTCNKCNKVRECIAYS